MKYTTSIRQWDFGTRTFKSAAPIEVLPAPVEPPPPDEPPPADPGLQVTNSINFGALAVGTTTPGFTNRWASAAGDWEVVADATAPSGKVMRCKRGTANGRRALSWDYIDSLTNVKRMQVCVVWSATGPITGRALVRGAGTTATATGYVAGAGSASLVGFTTYANGSASNQQIAATFGTGRYVTVLDDDGSLIRQKTWLLSNPEPEGWAPLLTDATTPFGWVGLFAFDTGGNTDFTHLSVGTGGLSAPRPPAAVAPVNLAPTADIGGDRSVVTGSTVTVTVGGSDADGTITTGALTLTAKPTDSTAAITGTFPTFTFVADVNGNYSLSGTVTDNGSPALTSAADTAIVTATASVAPAPTSSRGPNGQHWPRNTPQPWAAATFTAPSLEAAFDLLARCTGGEVIELTGTSAAGTDATGVRLSGGSTSWTSNVLIRASLFHTVSGFYTVTSNHVTMSGLRVTGDLNMSNSTRSFFARTKWETREQWELSSNKNCGLYECVIPDYRSGGGDDFLRVAGSGGSVNFEIVGCYLKGKWFIIGGGDQHCDTIQSYAPTTDAIGTKVIDSVVMTSADKVFQGENGQVQNMQWINCWLNSPSNRTEEPGAGLKAGSYGQSVSGPGSNFLFQDCTILGSVNHKPSKVGDPPTTNTGTFRRCKVKGGDALRLNNPTVIDTVSSGDFNITNNPPPALANLLTIWAKPA